MTNFDTPAAHFLYGRNGQPLATAMGMGNIQRMGGPNPNTGAAFNAPSIDTDMISARVLASTIQSVGGVPMMIAFSGAITQSPLPLGTAYTGTIIQDLLTTTMLAGTTQTIQRTAVGGPGALTITIPGTSVPLGMRCLYPLIEISIASPTLTALANATMTMTIGGVGQNHQPVNFNVIGSLVPGEFQFQVSQNSGTLAPTGFIARFLLVPSYATPNGLIAMPSPIALANQYPFAGAAPIDEAVSVTIGGLPDSSQVAVVLPTQQHPSYRLMADLAATAIAMANQTPAPTT